MELEFHDLGAGLRSERIDPIFPGFDPRRESVAVFSPHDDDGLLGAGYLIRAVVMAGARVRVLIFCDGSAGYSRVEDRTEIVARRRSEAREAYAVLGVPAQDLHWLEVPDFSALHYLGWRLPGGDLGLFARIVPLLRAWRVSRLLIPNGRREHLDHTAAHLAGLFFGPQTGDAILADWGQAPPPKTTLVYSVWADFPPAASGRLAADRAIVAPLELEETVMAGLNQFASQADVISGLVAARAGRRQGNRALELYAAIDPRPRLDYEPYWKAIS